MGMATALMVGGPADGQTREITDDTLLVTHEHRVPVPRARRSGLARLLFWWLPSHGRRLKSELYSRQGDQLIHQPSRDGEIPPPSIEVYEAVPIAVFVLAVVAVRKLL
jgi:hypothetical protein